MPRILVVEDDSDVCQMLTELLGSAGYDAVCALGDQEAYNALRAGTGAFSTLVVDINLGRGTTGFDVARHARRLDPNIPVIYIKGASSSSMEAHGVSGGVLVAKPFDGADFLATLREQLGVPTTRALVVEDDVTNRRLLELILETKGAVVVFAKDGVEGVNAFEQGAFDVVLMDLQMPEMDGFEAIRRIRELEAERRSERTPILVVSAFTRAQDVQAASAAGADGHVGKPINVPDLLSTIEEMTRH